MMALKLRSQNNTTMKPMENEVNYLDIETDIKADRMVAVYLNGYIYEVCNHPRSFFVDLFTSIQDELVVGHYIKFDAKHIYREFGVMLRNLWCTHTAAKVLRNGKRNKDGSPVDNSLVGCLYHYLGVRDAAHNDKSEIRTNLSIKRKLTPKELEYIKADGDYLKKLHEVLVGYVQTDGLGFVMQVEMALIPVLIEKEVRGIRVDTDYLRHLVAVWTRGKRIAVGMLDRELNKIMHLSTRPALFIAYNYGSTEQITQIFKDFGLPVPTKKTQDGNKTVLRESNDEDAISEYIFEYPNSPLKRFLEVYLWHQEIKRLITSYGESLIEKVKGGYLHTEYKQLGAETGRLSSKNPNLQNLPANGHGAKVRRCFLPDYGEVFVDTDMDGAEIRIAADLSKDPLLMASIKDGVDMHSKLASATYSILAGERVEISKDKNPLLIRGVKLIPGRVRDRHKSVTFSYFYLGGPGRIYTIIGDDIRKFRSDVRGACKEVHAELGRQLPVLSAYLKSKVDTANTVGFLTLPKSGRRRYFNGSAYGDAANNDIQGINAEAIKVAMINMNKYFKQTGYGRLVLNVHDQLVSSCKPEHAQEVAEKQKQVMSDALTYFLSNLKGSSTVKITKNWEK